MKRIINNKLIILFMPLVVFLVFGCSSGRDTMNINATVTDIAIRDDNMSVMIVSFDDGSVIPIFNSQMAKLKIGTHYNMEVYLRSTAGSCTTDPYCAYRIDSIKEEKE